MKELENLPSVDNDSTMMGSELPLTQLSPFSPLDSDRALRKIQEEMGSPFKVLAKPKGPVSPPQQPRKPLLARLRPNKLWKDHKPHRRERKHSEDLFTLNAII